VSSIKVPPSRALHQNQKKKTLSTVAEKQEINKKQWENNGSSQQCSNVPISKAKYGAKISK